MRKWSRSDSRLRQSKVYRARGKWLAPVALVTLAPLAAAFVTQTFLAPSQELPRVPKGLGTAKSPYPGEHYHWRHVAIGAGGFITGLAFDPSGATRLARTDVYGAYLWEDDRWRQLVTAQSMPAQSRQQNGAADGAYEIAVAPSDPDRLYMAIKGELLTSTNRGKSWTPPAAGLPFPVLMDANGPYRMYGPFIAVAPDDPDLVLFGTPSAGLWRSIDGGKHWMRVDSVPPSTMLANKEGDRTGARGAPGALIWFEPGKAARIWVMSPGHGMFVSTDRGVTFKPLPSRSGNAPRLLRRGVFARDGSFFAVDSEGRAGWRYRDGDWTNLTASGALEAREFAAVAADPNSDAIFIFDVGSRTYRSSNGGASWSRVLQRSVVGDRDPPWLHVANVSYFATADVRFDPVERGRMWIGAGTGVYYADLPTLNPMLTWTSRARGIEQLVANDVVQAPGMAPVFAGWDFGIHVKPDLDSFSTTFGPVERVVIAAQQVAWTPANPAFLATNASDTRIGCCTDDGLTIMAGYSEDGGLSWKRFASLPVPPGTKAGDPWAMSFGMIAVSANDTNNIIWAPSFNRSPYFTLDRGRSWTRVVLPGEKLPYTGSHSIYYMQRKTLAADRVLPGVFYLVHSGEGANGALKGLWRTDDGGIRWRREFTGEIAPNSRFAAKLRTVPGKAEHMFFTAAVDHGKDTRLRFSEDGGRSWSVIAAADHVDDIGFGKAAAGRDYPTIFVSGRINGQYGVWRSTDQAATWQRLAEFPLSTLDQVTVIEGDKDVFGRVYLGYKGSGWIYGEPAPCQVRASQRPWVEQCSPVR